MGFSWLPENCGNCGRRLRMHDEDEHGRHARRHVPHRGRKLPVCGECARLLDNQQQLDVDEPPEAA